MVTFKKEMKLIEFDDYLQYTVHVKRYDKSDWIIKDKGKRKGYWYLLLYKTQGEKHTW